MYVSECWNPGKGKSTVCVSNATLKTYFESKLYSESNLFKILLMIMSKTPQFTEVRVGLPQDA